MDFESILDILSSSRSPNSKDFFVKIFTRLSQLRKKTLLESKDILLRLCTEEYDGISKRLDQSQFQDSCSVRNVLKTRRLAQLLITEKGELNLSVLKHAIQLIEENLYFIGPDRQHDSIRQEYLLKTLKVLLENKDVQKQLKHIGKPFSNKIAEELIRDTLRLSEKTVITDTHARRAALSALLCYLRQNVGSCFATAPCIIVHDEQPVQFLVDINELLNTGRLKRTWSGVEYSVPLSPTWGAGDLKRVLPLYKENMSASPGLIAACEAVKLIDVDQTYPEKVEKLKLLITEILGSKADQEVITSGEGIIRHLLLKSLQITEKDLEEYQQRSTPMIQSSMLVQTPHGGGGVGQACANFFIQFEIAKNSFKALSDNALLKAWEYTVACFAENKAGFTRWNLYSSLGLHTQEKGSIGQCLYTYLQQKLEELNSKLRELNEEHEQIYAQIKYMESRIKHASESEAPWLRADYQSKRNEFYTFEELKNKVQMRASRYANLYDQILQQYDELFPKYFQEVYDADMHDVTTGPYDDSPAGFRLLYKFGRSNPSAWTRIYTPAQFIDSLASFFSITESEIAASEAFKGIEDDYTEITTAIISHIRTQEFLETAFYRMAAAHQTRIVKNPLEHLDQIEKKPWSYTSGGSMQTLVSTYFRRDQNPKEATRWMDNPMELFVFLADEIKHSQASITELFLKDPKKSILMNSPTHAFIFKPGMDSFKQTWLTDSYTYTWTRDQLVQPMHDFIENIWLNEEMMEYLVEHLSASVPENYRHYFKKLFSRMHGPMNSEEFRDHLAEGLNKEMGIRSGGKGVLSTDVIDSALFSLLPLFPIGELYERVRNIFDQVQSSLPFEKNDFQIDSCVSEIMKGFLGTKILNAQDLQDICKAIICLFLGSTSSPIDFHRLIADAARKLGYAMPQPILFADTNWVKDYFAFVVNPGNRRLELWRTDILGTQGAPMSMWDRWLNGSDRQAKWGVYMNPYEYTF